MEDEAIRWKWMKNPSSAVLLGSLGYSYFFVGLIIPKGILRLLFLLPVLYSLALLPWYFQSALLRGILSFFITWISSFKLLLFCFNHGPLTQSQSFLDFILIAILPIQIKHNSNIDKSSTKSLASEFLGLVGMGMERYEWVEVLNKPYLATSLQDFWGKRWNRYSSNMLRETVYNPTRKVLAGVVGVGVGVSCRVVALLLSLIVSGLLHEMMLYYITCGKKPTWEVTWYFVVQGLAMALEAAALKMKMKIEGGTNCWTCTTAWAWAWLHHVVSVVWPCGFVLVTFYWLLVLPVWRDGQNSCNHRPSHVLTTLIYYGF